MKTGKSEKLQLALCFDFVAAINSVQPEENSCEKQRGDNRNFAFAEGKRVVQIEEKAIAEG